MDEAGVATTTRSLTNDDPLSPSPDENGTATIVDHISRSPSEEARFKRQYVIQELVETERQYVTDLSLVVDGYIAELSNVDLPEDLAGKDKIIFANIAQILEFHKTCFVKEIEKCLENYEAAGSAFTKYVSFPIFPELCTVYQKIPKKSYIKSCACMHIFFIICF